MKIQAFLRRQVFTVLLVLLAACTFEPAAPGARPTRSPLTDSKDKSAPTASEEAAVEAPTAAPSRAPTEIPLTTRRETPLAVPAGLTVEEYALAAAPAFEPLSFQPVQRMQAGIRAKRSVEREKGFRNHSFFEGRCSVSR